MAAASAMVNAEYRFCAAFACGSDADDTVANCCWRLFVDSDMDRPAARIATMSTTAANVSRPGDVNRNDMVRFGYSRAGASRSPRIVLNVVAPPPSSRSSTRSSGSRSSFDAGGGGYIAGSTHTGSPDVRGSVADDALPSSDPIGVRRWVNRVLRGLFRTSGASAAIALRLPSLQIRPPRARGKLCYRC